MYQQYVSLVTFTKHVRIIQSFLVLVSLGDKYQVNPDPLAVFHCYANELKFLVMVIRFKLDLTFV